MSRESVHELTAESSGRWLVCTATAAYEIDLDADTLALCPLGGLARRNETPLRLRRIVACVTGQRASFLVAIGDTETTLRLRKPVSHISTWV